MNNKLRVVIFIALLFILAAVPLISNCQTNPEMLIVELTAPTDGFTVTSFNVDFTYNATIIGAASFGNATLFLNGTATAVTNQTAIVNATDNTISYLFTANGTYLWNVQVQNGTGTTDLASASSDFTVFVAVPGPTPTAIPTATPNATATPTASPTPSPSPHPTPTPTPLIETATPTATPIKIENGTNFLLIGGLAVVVLAVVAASLVFLKKRKVSEKGLKKFSSRNFQDWVIKRFNGKPGDSASGVDGFTMGGQPLLIKQSDSVSLAEVEAFAAVLAKGKAQKGVIVAFNFGTDALEGKLNAMDNNGIEIQMLPIHELVNNRYAGRINEIASSQVAFDASLVGLVGGGETFGEMPSGLQKEGLKKPLIFISHSKNPKIADQVKKLLDFVHYDYVVADKTESTTSPIPANVFGLMKDCDCAIINVTAYDQERRPSGLYILNSDVLTEISGAYLKYNMQVILLVERKVQLPSNLQGLKRIEYVGDDLSFTAAMELQKALIDFRKI